MGLCVCCSCATDAYRIDRLSRLVLFSILAKLIGRGRLGTNTNHVKIASLDILAKSMLATRYSIEPRDQNPEIRTQRSEERWIRRAR